MTYPPRKRCPECWRFSITTISQNCIRPANAFEPSSRAGESRPPFEDDNVYYYGQFVALVVADTFEQAQEAAAAVHVDYDTKKPAVFMSQGTPSETPAAQQHRGDAESAFKQAPVQLEATYTTPVETHNPMEMHGTIAVWRQDKVTLYESSQGVVNHHHVMSEMLGIPLENMEVISPFIGSGFGCKLFPVAAFAACCDWRAARWASCEIVGAAHADVHHCRPSSG